LYAGCILRPRIKEANMEFFKCPCPETGNDILDGNDQGPNRDDAGILLTKMCNSGLHWISLECLNGKECVKKLVRVVDTDPILPMEVPFQCEE
jgi:hypothetical protein